MITLLVMTDGRRQYLEKTIPSALANLKGPVTNRVIHDDSADPTFRAWLKNQYPTFEIVSHEHRLGFGGAIRVAWEHVRHADEQFTFTLEDDFTFNRRVELGDMIDVLESDKHLMQMALRRQPWNDVEREAGGVVEVNPDAFIDVDEPHPHLEHRLFWTTNPSLYRTELTYMHPWPKGARSEGVFTANLLRSPKVRFGYWGSRDSGEWVTHIGEERVGVGY